jgi:hypothetical protein
MAEILAAPVRRVVTPVAALLFAIALLAAVALGFGLRTWTQSDSHTDSPTIVVSGGGSTAQPVCRVGHPC